MHRSAVPNRAANSRSPAIRSPFRRSGLCYPKARWPTRTFSEPVLTGQGYKPGHLVTGEEVSALWGVMQGDKASKGFLTTTSDFAPKIKDNPFIAEFIPSRLELINGE